MVPCIDMRIDCGNKCVHFVNRRIDQFRFSDEDPTMARAAERAFEHILEQLQASNLNFQLQLSPFSASISLKKSLVRDKTGKLLLPHYTPVQHGDQEVKHQHSLLVSENDNLKEQIKELLTSKQSSFNTIEILEQKVAKSEASALKTFQERKSDVEVLTKSLKTANNDLASCKKDLQVKNKCIKEKEREIYKLEQKSENLASNLQKAKTKISSLESERTKLVKEQKIVKVKKTKHISTNTSPSFSPILPLGGTSTCSVTSSPSDPSLSTAVLTSAPHSTTDLLYNNKLPKLQSQKSPRRSRSPHTPPGTPPPNPVSTAKPSAPHSIVEAPCPQSPPTASGTPPAFSDSPGLSEGEFQDFKQIIQEMTDRFCEKYDEMIHD